MLDIWFWSSMKEIICHIRDDDIKMEYDSLSLKVTISNWMVFRELLVS